MRAGLGGRVGDLLVGEVHGAEGCLFALVLGRFFLGIFAAGTDFEAFGELDHCDEEKMVNTGGTLWS